jgi:hypothetical protein
MSRCTTYNNVANHFPAYSINANFWKFIKDSGALHTAEDKQKKDLDTYSANMSTFYVAFSCATEIFVHQADMHTSFS